MSILERFEKYLQKVDPENNKYDPHVLDLASRQDDTDNNVHNNTHKNVKVSRVEPSMYIITNDRQLMMTYFKVRVNGSKLVDKINVDNDKNSKRSEKDLFDGVIAHVYTS